MVSMEITVGMAPCVWVGAAASGALEKGCIFPWRPEPAISVDRLHDAVASGQVLRAAVTQMIEEIWYFG